MAATSTAIKVLEMYYKCMKILIIISNQCFGTGFAMLSVTEELNRRTPWPERSSMIGLKPACN
jgi:hypothetical protein